MILEINNLKKFYSKKCVLNIENLHIERGQKVAITGSNGSGKSTLLKLVLDLVKADEGDILLFGKNVKINETWKFKTAAFLDDSFLLEFLTVREYLHFVAKDATDDAISELISRLNFTSIHLNEYIKNLSNGNKKKAGILGVLLTNRDLLIFDEVCNFLDNESKKGLSDYLGSLTNCTVILVEHNIDFIHQFATQIIILEQGLVIEDTQSENSL